VSEEFNRQEILGPAETVIDTEQLDESYLVIDVRSAAEYAGGTLPGAVNIPLFDEDERSVVGTIYRYGGRDKAIDRGLDYVSDKITEMLASFEEFRGRRLAVVCARGGMRSRSVVNLLQGHGYDASQLRGGYKQYRNEVLAKVNAFAPRLIVLHGLTGCGKTRIIENLEHAIDLEDMAQHRSSLFGAIDREPCNQRTFETNLARAITDLGDEPYFIEGESRKIGQVFIPKPLALAMKSATMVYIECSLETRVRRIIEDYPVHDEQTLLQVDEIIKSLGWKVGKDKVEEMRELLQQRDLPQLVRMLLVDYYDKRYARSMRNYSYALTVSSEDIEQSARILTDFRANLQP